VEENLFHCVYYCKTLYYPLSPWIDYHPMLEYNPDRADPVTVGC